MKYQTEVDQRYNVIGKVAFSAVPWSLLKKVDAPKGAIQTWAALQKRNVFGAVKWTGFQSIQDETGFVEADLKVALQWLSANALVKIDKERNEVTVIIRGCGRDQVMPDTSGELANL